MGCTEEGDYVALDLGGTNFRVLLVHLRPGETPKLASQAFLIPSSLMHAPGTQVGYSTAKHRLLPVILHKVHSLFTGNVKAAVINVAEHT